MTTKPQISLTQDQQEAYDKFQGFLLSDQTEFHLFGAAGCGKTFLVRHFLTQGIKQYNKNCKVLGKQPYQNANIYLTATTNKAVEVLKQSIKRTGCTIDTIFSVFHVIVQENYSTGKTYLQLQNPNFCLEDSLIFIDECSMLSTQMLNIIHQHSENCKFVYIGDSYQLAPVNEKPHWDNTPALTTTHLYTPVRNQNQQALVDLCKQLRETVKTLEFKPIQLVSGVIESLDDDQARNWIQKADFSKNKIIAYTNVKALKYINLIEHFKGFNFPFRVGENYINNTHFEQKNKVFYPEEEVTLLDISSKPVMVKDIWSHNSMMLYKVKVQSLSSPKKVVEGYCPTDTEKFRLDLKQLATKKSWPSYFWFKESVFDLRLPYACTVHKSQGNTYDEVLVDCGSFKICDNPATAARLLYVAVSRAKNKVLFYGKLPKKYGEFI